MKNLTYTAIFIGIVLFLSSALVQEKQDPLIEVEDSGWQSRAEYIEDSESAHVNDFEADSHGIKKLREYKIFGGLSGKDVHVGVWDLALIQDNHKDFEGRLYLGKNQNDYVSAHATHVGGTIAGSGKAQPGGQTRGMAPKAILHSFNYSLGEQDHKELRCAIDPDYSDDCNETNDDSNIAISLSNHSYGTTTPNYYSKAGRFDETIFRYPNHTAFVAAGNLENGELQDFRILFDEATAKNVITVGSITSFNEDKTEYEGSNSSLWGPTNDGRIKPDVVAIGEVVYSSTVSELCFKDNVETDQSSLKCKLGNEILEKNKGIAVSKSGTSMATPIVTGTAALLNELAKKYLSREFCADEMKAILIHTAANPYDGFYQGPSYKTGWGRLDAYKAGKFIISSTGHRPDKNSSFFRYQIRKKETLSFEAVWKRIGDARITVVWLDKPHDDLDLFSDIDVHIQSKNAAGEVIHYYPWSLSLDENDYVDVRKDKKNDVDNIERIDIEYTKEVLDTTWQIKIKSPKKASFTIATSNLVISDLEDLEPMQTCGK